MPRFTSPLANFLFPLLAYNSSSSCLYLAEENFNSWPVVDCHCLSFLFWFCCRCCCLIQASKEEAQFETRHDSSLSKPKSGPFIGFWPNFKSIEAQQVKQVKVGEILGCHLFNHYDGFHGFKWERWWWWWWSSCLELLYYAPHLWVESSKGWNGMEEGLLFKLVLFW